MVLQKEKTRQAHDVNITSPQRRCNVMTLHRRWGDDIFTWRCIDVEATLYLRHVPAGNLQGQILSKLLISEETTGNSWWKHNHDSTIMAVTMMMHQYTVDSRYLELAYLE